MLRAQERKSSLPRCRRGGSKKDRPMSFFLVFSGQPPSWRAGQPARLSGLSAIRYPLSASL